VAEFKTEINDMSIIQRVPDQEFSKIDNEVVMLNVESAKYFALNEVASRIWELIEEKVTVNQIINSLMEEYDVSLQQCSEDVFLYLHALNAKSLILVS